MMECFHHCGVCDESFSNLRDLERHLISHKLKKTNSPQLNKSNSPSYILETETGILQIIRTPQPIEQRNQIIDTDGHLTKKSHIYGQPVQTIHTDKREQPAELKVNSMIIPITSQPIEESYVVDTVEGQPVELDKSKLISITSQPVDKSHVICTQGQSVELDNSVLIPITTSPVEKSRVIYTSEQSVEIDDNTIIAIAADEDNNITPPDPFVIQAKKEPENDSQNHEAFTNYNDKFRRFVCSYCSKKCFTKFELDNHERSHTKERPYSCYLCDKTYKARVGLYKHLKNKHPGATMPTNSVLIKNDRDSSKYKHICTYCGKGLSSADALVAHERIHTGSKPFQCSECQKPFTTRGAVFMHMRRVHKKEPMMVQPKMLKVCVTNPTVPVYDDQEENELPQTKTIRSLINQKEANQESNPRPFQCPYCPKTWKQKIDLIKHVRFHTGERPFKCDLCSKAYFTKAEVKNHMLQYHNIDYRNKPKPPKPPKLMHKCPYCPKMWKCKFYLIHHVNRHTGEKPYLCPVCPQAFIRSPHLRKHIVQAHDWESLKDRYSQILAKVNRYNSTLTFPTSKGPLNEALNANCSESGNCGESGEINSGHNTNTTSGKKVARSSRDSMNLTLHKLKCSFCGKGWKCRTALRVHERSHTGERPFQCSECKMSFATRGAVYLHMRRRHKKEPVMKKCSMVRIYEKGNDDESVKQTQSNEDNSPNIDSDSHDDVPPLTDFKCSFCDIAPFPTFAERDQHERVHVSRKTSNACLTITENGVIGDPDLQGIQGARKYKCSFCNKRWNDRFARGEHESTHSRKRDRLIQCSECLNTFTTRASANAHMRYIHKKEPIMKKKRLEKVGRLSEKNRMNTNTNQHHDDIDKTQDESAQNKTSTDLSQCQGGVSLSIGRSATKCFHDGRWRCPYCPKTWKGTSNLLNHVKYHTEEKSFKCPACEKGFYRKALLLVHIEEKHEDHKEIIAKKDTFIPKPCKCPYCPVEKRLKIDLAKHVRTRHKDEEITDIKSIPGQQGALSTVNLPGNSVVQNESCRSLVENNDVKINSQEKKSEYGSMWANDARVQAHKMLTRAKRKKLTETITLADGATTTSRDPRSHQYVKTMNNQSIEGRGSNCIAENDDADGPLMQEVADENDNDENNENSANERQDRENDHIDIALVKREIVEQPVVSFVNCTHGVVESHKTGVGKEACSSSRLSVSQKVIRVNYNGQVRLFTLQPFDCHKCAHGEEVSACSRTNTNIGNDNKTHRETAIETIINPPCTSTNCDDSNDNEYDIDLDHVQEIISQSEAFENEIHGLMTTDTSSAPAISVSENQPQIKVKVEPAEVVLATDVVSSRYANRPQKKRWNKIIGINGVTEVVYGKG